MKLKEAGKRHLRGLAHRLRPCIQIGMAGVTPAVLAELENALARHELIKVKIRAAGRQEREDAVAALIANSGAALVSRIGNVAVIYRPNPEAPRLVLPAEPDTAH